MHACGQMFLTLYHFTAHMYTKHFFDDILNKNLDCMFHHRPYSKTFSIMQLFLPKNKLLQDLCMAQPPHRSVYDIN